MTPEKAIACIDEVLISTVNFDESLEYELSSYDIDWLEEAREALVQKTEHDKISRSVKEFWGELEKLSIVKGKDKPTLEELLEYMEALKDEVIKEISERLKSKKTTAISCDLFEEVVRLSDIESIINETVADAKIATTTEAAGE